MATKTLMSIEQLDALPEKETERYELDAGVLITVLASPSVLPQKFVEKFACTRPAFSEPRQGRQIIAQGVSPGLDGPHPAFGTPLPPERERGRG